MHRKSESDHVALENRPLRSSVNGAQFKMDESTERGTQSTAIGVPPKTTFPSSNGLDSNTTEKSSLEDQGTSRGPTKLPQEGPTIKSNRQHQRRMLVSEENLLAYRRMIYICSSAHEMNPGLASQDLLNKLILQREECKARPIIVVAYGLGALIVGRALIKADGAHTALLSSLAGIVLVDAPLDTMTSSVDSSASSKPREGAGGLGDKVSNLDLVSNLLLIKVVTLCRKVGTTLGPLQSTKEFISFAATKNGLRYIIIEQLSLLCRD